MQKTLFCTTQFLPFLQKLTIENKSQKNPVLSLVIKADEKTISCLKSNDSDLLNVGNIIESGIAYQPSTELAVENIMLDQNFIPEKKKVG